VTQDEYRAEQARQHHADAAQLTKRARDLRLLRNALVRALRASNPDYWTLSQLGRELGCSKELIAHILRCGHPWSGEDNHAEHARHTCHRDAEHEGGHACSCGALKDA
jgi:hypothetical protein